MKCASMRTKTRDTETTNLSLDRRTKKVLIALAVQDGLPVSQIVERLTIEEAQRRQMPTPFPVRRVDAVNPAPLNPPKRLARAVKK